MSANVDSRPPPVSNYVYPKFHDVQSSRTTKDIQLDNAICQILAHYLNADVLDAPSKLTRPLPTPTATKHKPNSLPPYWKVKSGRPYQQTHRNWFGEAESVPKDVLILQRNTLKNSKRPVQPQEDIPIPVKLRSKSVSFNETVTVISQDHLTESQLKQGSGSEAAVATLDEDDDNFVDAVENFEDFVDEN